MQQLMGSISQLAGFWYASWLAWGYQINICMM